MLVPHTIFTNASLRPLLRIWTKLQEATEAAFFHRRTFDIRGDFAVLANAWKSLAQDNTAYVLEHHKTKARIQSHEAAAAKRVQETYNDFLKGYNQQHRTNAVALGSLWTGAPEDVVAFPGKLLPTMDPITYALDLAHFHQQHWTNALGFLAYTREVLNLHEAHKTLTVVANNIEQHYFEPLHKQATTQWLTLLVIGGTADDLQLAREKLAAPYVSGTYDTRTFLNSPMGSDTPHAMSEQLRHAFVRGLSHPRSSPRTPPNSTHDLGL